MPQRALRALLTPLLVMAALPLLPLRAQTPCTNGDAGGFACDNVSLMARIPVGETGPLRTAALNDIWGWTDPTTDREYALVGTRSGTVFVDVTTPTAPLVLGKLLTNGFPASTANSIWRDIKTYDHYAFIVSEAPGHGMQVFDLARLRGLSADANRDFTADALYTGAGKAHNIAIDDVSGFAYLLGANQSGYQCNGGGLHIVDIRDPLQPTFAGCFDSDGYTHDAQCLIYDGPDADYTGHQLCITSQGSFANNNHIGFVDVTDKANPVLINTATYSSPAYTHQSWLTEDRRHLMVDDEIDEQSIGFGATRTMVFDVADLDNPEFGFFYFSPLNTSDHNQYVRGHYVFQSNYASGLRILDIADIDASTIVEVGSFDTYPDANTPSYEGQWSNYPYFPSGTLIVSDQSYGLFVLNAEFPLTTDSAAGVPAGETYVLGDAYPNPFNAASQLTLTVARTQAVHAEVIDLTGRRVAVLHEGALAADRPLRLTVDGASLLSGLYLVRILGEDFDATQRISVVH